MAIYGPDFAAVFNERWAFWAPKMWPFLSRQVARRAPEAHTWLDLCCGTGSLLTLVCAHGYEAVGLDLSPHQLAYARQNAPQARLVEADVRTFDLGQTFDVVTCLFDSLNYLTNKRDLAQALRAARRHLAAGGLFIFDMNTLEGLRTMWQQTMVLRDPGRIVINETSFDETRGLGTCRITGFVQAHVDFRRFEEEHVQRGYTPDELDALLARVGFRFTRWDGNHLSRARKRSGRLLYVCRRAKG